jgi:hypothetical protein
MTWKDFIRGLVLDFCNQRGNRTFTLGEFKAARREHIQGFSTRARTPLNTTRRILQELRDEGFLSFVDNSGTYTLRGVEFLDEELPDARILPPYSETPERREYLVETYARSVGWARKAKETFGLYCMYPECGNTFPRPDGTPYIEVHHIVPLYLGGEDGIWNLSVLCAHHHRMAHHADAPTVHELQALLQRENVRLRGEI